MQNDLRRLEYFVRTQSAFASRAELGLPKLRDRSRPRHGDRPCGEDHAAPQDRRTRPRTRQADHLRRASLRVRERGGGVIIRSKSYCKKYRHLLYAR